MTAVIVAPQALRRLGRTARARRTVAAAQRRARNGDLRGAIARLVDAGAALEAEVGRPGGPTPAELIAVWHLLAGLHRSVVALPAAVKVLDRALDVLQEEPIIPERETQLCETLTMRGDTLRALARHHDARRDLDAALDAAPDEIMRARTYNAVGILCKDTGNFEAAAHWYRLALEVTDAVPGREPELAAILHNLAGLAHARGDYLAGEPHIRRAIELRALGHGDAAALLSDRTVLAALLAGQLRDDEARPLLEELVDEWARLRGPDHYEVAHCRHHLGRLLVRTGETHSARAELQAAQHTLARVHGADHPEVRTISSDLTMLAGAAPADLRKSIQ